GAFVEIDQGVIAAMDRRRVEVRMTGVSFDVERLGRWLLDPTVLACPLRLDPIRKDEDYQKRKHPNPTRPARFFRLRHFHCGSKTRAPRRAQRCPVDDLQPEEWNPARVGTDRPDPVPCLSRAWPGRRPCSA